MTTHTEIVAENSLAAAASLVQRLLESRLQFAVEPVPNRMHPDMVAGWSISYIDRAEREKVAG